jgi:hypothetical protein
LIKKREAAAITSALLAHLQVKEPATMTSNICVSKDLDITYFKLDFQVMNMAATTLSSEIQSSAIQHRTNSILCQKEKKRRRKCMWKEKSDAFIPIRLIWSSQ